MMKKIFFIACILLNYKVFAQVGVTGSLNFASVESSGSGSSKESFDSSTAISFGIFYDHPLNEKIVFSGELGYSTYKADFTHSDYPTTTGNLTFSYIVLRPSIHFIVQEGLTLLAGTTIGLPQTSEIKLGTISWDYSKDSNSDVKTRLALNFGASYLIPVNTIKIRPKFMYELALNNALEKTNSDYEAKFNSLIIGLDFLF